MSLVRYVFVSLFCLVCTPSVYAATLHGIVVGDTLDESIGVGVVKNLELIHKELVNIARLADLELRETMIDEINYDPQLIVSVLQDLQTEEDDVLFYYHNSHGFRTEDMEDPWPNFFFGWGQYYVGCVDVMHLLSQKPHRLSIVFAETCNNCVPVHPSWNDLCSQGIELEWRTTASAADGYRKLFREASGMIVTSASQPGQYAWISLERGSLYTCSFLKSLHRAVHHRSVSWPEILEEAGHKTLNLSLSLKCTSRQDPQFQIFSQQRANPSFDQ